jgi:hypothetical protein
VLIFMLDERNRNYVALRKLLAIISPGLLAVLLILAVFLVKSPDHGAVKAAPDAAPPFQAEDYPGPGQDDPGLPDDVDDPYPMVTATAEGQPTGDAQPTPIDEGQPTAEAPTVTPEATDAGSDYPPGEDADPSTSTPAAGETAPPPATATPEPPNKEPEPEETMFALQPPASTGGGQGGLALNWTLFWVGFSLPVVLACGVVLYLLDRNPRLFYRKKKLMRSEEASGINTAPLPDQSEK